MPDRQSIDWCRRIEAVSSAAGLSLPREVVDELASHLADVYQSECDAGRSDADAMAVAERLLRDATYRDLRETRRATSPPTRLIERAPARASTWAADLRFDLHYAWRTMRRERIFSLAVIVILATGIGATTAAYSVLDAVLFRQLPYPVASELVVLKHATPTEQSMAFSPADWLDYTARQHDSVLLASYASWPMNLTGSGAPERLTSVIVSGDFFTVAGSRPLLGRVADAHDDSPSAPPVVVLSHGFWTRHFGASRSCIGTALVVNGRPATIIGVMPADFALPSTDVDLWMPMGLAPDVLADRAGEWLSVIGRLRAGVRVARLQADLLVTSAQLATEYPRTNAGDHASVGSLYDEVIGAVRRPLWLGGLAVVFVLLAGAANAANLMLARATLRHDEFAIRTALGAAPFRLTRQLFAESALLASLGCLIGLGLSWGFLRAFALLADGRVPRLDGLRPDGTSLVAAVVSAGICMLLVGGVAAGLLLRAQVNRSGSTTPRVTRSLAAAGPLLVAQIAFAIMLLAGTAVIARTYLATLRIDPGFDTSDTTTMQLTLPRGTYADNATQIQFVARAEQALGRLPGASQVGVVSDLPFVGNATHFPVGIDGESKGQARLTAVRLADEGFFRTLRIPLAAGRYFEPTDRGGAPLVAVVNRTAAVRFGRGPAALGRRLQIEGDATRTIVGIVGDIRHAGLQAEEGPVVYVPYAQKTFAFLNWMGLLVRAPHEALSAASIKQAISSVDPNQPVQAIQLMTDYVTNETAPFRFGGLVIGSLACAGLLLAAIGIYGLTAFMVGRRSRELAVRLALGATGVHVATVVCRQTAVALMVGALIGLSGSVLTNRLLQSVLPGAPPGRQDLVAVLIACAVMVVASGLATLIPAVRAARLDPKTALQTE